MIFPDHKKAATMILSKAKGGVEKQTEKMPEESMEPGMEGLDSASEDILQAIQSKSPIDLRKGLKAFFDMADQDDSEDEAPEGFQS